MHAPQYYSGVLKRYSFVISAVILTVQVITKRTIVDHKYMLRTVNVSETSGAFRLRPGAHLPQSFQQGSPLSW